MIDLTVSAHPFGDLPESPGIYAAYLDLGILYKPVKDKREYPDKEVRFSGIIEKIIRSHVLPDPKEVDINLYGKIKNNYLKISTSHNIEWGKNIDQKESKEEIAEFISKLSILSKPIYIGKTTKDTIKGRINKHMSTLSNISTDDEEAERARFSQEDELAHKLFRRGIEFRDLLVVCAPAEPGTPDEAITLGESFMQAIANPSLSVSN